MIEWKVLTCTNMEGRRLATDREKEWKNVTKHELMAFIGLTILSGSDKNWDVPVCVFLGLLYITHCTGPLCQFEDLKIFAVSCAFIEKRTRAYRLKIDHMALWRVWRVCLRKDMMSCWHMGPVNCQLLILVNCRQKFIPSDCVTVDEQLVPFRGMTRLLQYMLSKSAKYSIKIFWGCDARTPYAVDGMGSCT